MKLLASALSVARQDAFAKHASSLPTPSGASATSHCPDRISGVPPLHQACILLDVLLSAKQPLWLVMTLTCCM